MSDREIEDVLSSIRRLVAREAERPAPGRLVLTEAQRVADNDGGAPAAPAAGQGASTESGAGARARARAQAAVAGAGALAKAPDGAADEVAGEVAGRDSSGAAARPDAAPDAATESASPAEPAMPEPHIPAAPATEDAGHEDAPVSGASGMAQPAPDGPAAAWHSSAGEAGTDGDVTGYDSGDEEAGQDGDGDDGATTLAEELIDEEALRALVAQLVREELRGQLGERVTIQVRKLVRAEIARALDEREYL